MEVLEAIKSVQAAAEKNVNGDAIAHKQLLQEIHRLRLVAEAPDETAWRQRLQAVENVAVRLSVELGLLQYLASQKRRHVTAAELSKHTGHDELLIARIMRVITYVGACDEIDYLVYASNATTETIVLPGLIGGEKHHGELFFRVAGNIVDMFRHQGIHQFPSGPTEKSPFQYAYGSTLFEYFEKDTEQKEAFDAYMSMKRPVDAPQWFDVYPAKEELTSLKDDANAALVVDVGGGIGHDLNGFQKRFPQLPGKLILQDVPTTIKNLPPDLGKIEPMAIDFFVDQPVKAARIYYCHHILHDWSDEKCKIILSHIVKAMEPGYSRLILDEYVLPNTGVSGHFASVDLLMMMYVSGIERTVRQWTDLLASVGLEIIKIWPADSERESVIEAGIKQ